MKKLTNVRRPKFADEKYLGSEPTITAESTQADLTRAYSWYNYFYTSDDAKSFTLSYLKSIKYDKDIIRKLSKARPFDLHNVGWNCRLLENGSTIPDETWKYVTTIINNVANSITLENEPMETSAAPVKIISIQDRITAKISDLIGELEEQYDIFFQEGVVQFDVKKWSLEKAIKPNVAKKIREHFYPQYEEIAAAIDGKDEELKESYRGWRKPVLKIMSVFLKRICDHMTELESVGVTVRKPRKKKIKPASVLVSKMNYCQSNDTLKSIDPKEIIGASQLWVYNIKTRNLSVYNAVGHSGLSVRGTTLTGFDAESSITKKLRKPESVIKPLLEGGKIYLRKVMENIKATENKATGRINSETILLRVVK